MKRVFDTKSDVWAYGITMWEIFSFGTSPYPEWDNAKTIQELRRGYRMPIPDYNFSKEETKNAIYNVSFKSLLSDMLWVSHVHAYRLCSNAGTRNQ